MKRLGNSSFFGQYGTDWYIHEFLRAYVDIFTKNVYATTDYTYKHLKRIIKDPNLVVVSGNKESCVVIMNKSELLFIKIKCNK